MGGAGGGGEGPRWLWAAVKPAGRALEKLLRSYDCDASRLLDCCRQTVVLEGAADLLACVDALRADPELELMRLRNGLDPDRDSSRSGGFRCGTHSFRPPPRRPGLVPASGEPRHPCLPRAGVLRRVSC